MRKALTIAAILAAAAAILAAATFFGASWLGDRKIARKVDVRVVPVAYAPRDPQVLKLGKYLFESRGCGECHGMDGAGRVMADVPGGMYIRAPDLTPAGPTARYGEADWVRAVRHGVDPSGRALLIMPSDDYARMHDADFSALVAYIRALPPGRGTPGEVRFPAIVKALYGAGMIRDASEKIDHRLPPPAPVPVAANAEHGGYVAQMCIGCHGPAFSGGRIPGAPPDWPPASNLTPGEGGVMERYAGEAAFIAMMRTGKRPDGGAVSKAMPFESLGRMDDTDLKAIHAFLRTLPARKPGER